jgi:hypothetical protein
MEDTMAALTELRRIERESERRFAKLLRRLKGMPEAEGVALVKELLAAFNRHRVEQAMKAKARFGAVH